MTGGGSIFTISMADFLVKSTDVAVMVTIVSTVTVAGARKVALVLVGWVRVPVPAGEAENTTPPFVTVSFSTLAVSATMPPWPTKIVPLGDIVTLWKASGVRAQLESCSTAKITNAYRHEYRARFFMAPPQMNGEIRLPESPIL